MAPGETVQFEAIGHFADGSTRNMTNEVPWNASDPRFPTVDSAGRATGQALGESNLHVQVNRIAANTEIVVVPTGTFRVSLVVREGGAVPQGIRVEATDATGARLVDALPENGRYDFYGVASGVVELRVTGLGYRDHIQRIPVTEHIVLEVEVAPVRPRVDISGRYTLTIEAHEGCRSALPEAMRVRRYVAQVTQRGPQISVSLEGADFASNVFSGTMDAASSQTSFFLFDGYYYYYYSSFPGVTERLGESQHLAFVGSAVTRVGQDSLSGIFDGSIKILDSTQRRHRTVAECQSRHPFLLSR